MWQYVVIGILCLAASSDALSACITKSGNNSVTQGQVCPGSPQLRLWDDRNAIDDKFKAFIDTDLREILRTGVGNLGPLDPLTIKNISLNLGEEGGTYEPLKLDLEDIVVLHLAEYVVYNASYSIIGFKFPVALDFPDITLTANYDMDGWLGNGLLYLYGDGSITFSLFNTSLYVELDVGTVNNILVLECLALDYNVGGVKINITGLLGGGELGDFFNAVLEDAIPTILDLAKDKLLGTVSCLLKDVANKLFQKNGTTLNDLLCFAGIRDCS